MDLIFKYTNKDYIQNPTHISLLLHITQFTKQHASCYRFSVFFPLSACVSLISLFSHIIYMNRNFSNISCTTNTNNLLPLFLPK